MPGTLCHSLSVSHVSLWSPDNANNECLRSYLSSMCVCVLCGLVCTSVSIGEGLRDRGQVGLLISGEGSAMLGMHTCLSHFPFLVYIIMYDYFCCVYISPRVLHAPPSPPHMGALRQSSLFRVIFSDPTSAKSAVIPSTSFSGC